MILYFITKMYFEILYWSLFIALINKDTAHMPDKKRWFCNHAIVNAIVIYLTIRDMFTILTNPFGFTYIECPSTNCIYTPDRKPASIDATLLVLLLHIYHILCYKVNKSDKIHHFVMCTVLLIPLYNSNNDMFLTFTNYSLFFLCGLPGFIDYTLMYKVESGEILLLEEKRINTYLNVWLRALGILYGAFVAYIYYIIGLIPIYYMLPVIISFIWNAQFYSYEVCVSYGVTMVRPVTL